MQRRHLIFLALIALAAVSCARVETDFTWNEEFGYEESHSPVVFSWYAARNNGATKANPDIYVGEGSSHLRSGNSFGVFGYFHPQSGTTSNPVAGGWKDGVNNNYPNFFYNEGVSIAERPNGKYAYTYTNSRFWPRNEYDRISFFAYYPYNPGIAQGTPGPDTIVESFLDSNYEREGLVGFYYIVKEQADQQVDFMISDLCLDQNKAVWENNHSQGLTIGNDVSATEDKTGTVKFFFHHALSQIRIKSVNFDASGNDKVTVNVNYIRFNNVAVFGQCIPVPDFTSTTSTGRTTVTPTWPANSLTNQRPDLTSGVQADVCYTDPDDPTTLIPDNILLMIPHEFFTGATIEVNFDVTRDLDDPNDPTGEHYEYLNNTLTAPLTTSKVYGWEPGKIYTYNINLNLKKITIDADVVDWIDAGDDVMMDNN